MPASAPNPMIKPSQGEGSGTVTSDRPWRPSRAVATLIGLLSLWPIIYFFLFFVGIGYVFTRVSAPGRAGGAPDLFRYIFVAHLATMMLMIVLTTIYVVHAFKTDQIPQDKKTLWVVVLFFGNMVAFPIYWYLYLWPSAVATEPPEHSGGQAI